MTRQMILFAVAASIAVTAGLASAAQGPTCSTGCINEYAMPIPPVYNGPFGLARGMSDDIWFGDQDTISRIDKSGELTSYQTSRAVTASCGSPSATPTRSAAWATTAM
jgi:ribosomal protein L37E